MNLELSKICADNAELRTDIQHMLDKRRKMIEEYNQLRLAMQNATDESRQLASECSDSYANRYRVFFTHCRQPLCCCRRDLVARMQSMRDQHERDEKKLLDDIRELDRLLESNYASKNFILNKSNLRQEQTRLNELFAGKRELHIDRIDRGWQTHFHRFERSEECLHSRWISSSLSSRFRSRFLERENAQSNYRDISRWARTVLHPVRIRRRINRRSTSILRC